MEVKRRKKKSEKEQWENVRRRIKGGAVQVNVDGRPVRSVHCGVLAEQSVPLLSLQDEIPHSNWKKSILTSDTTPADTVKLVVGIGGLYLS